MGEADVRVPQPGPLYLHSDALSQRSVPRS
jgi:hypothetical protein